MLLCPVASRASEAWAGSNMPLVSRYAAAPEASTLLPRKHPDHRFLDLPLRKGSGGQLEAKTRAWGSSASGLRGTVSDLHIWVLGDLCAPPQHQNKHSAV